MNGGRFDNVVIRSRDFSKNQRENVSFFSPSLSAFVVILWRIYKSLENVCSHPFLELVYCSGKYVLSSVLLHYFLLGIRHTDCLKDCAETLKSHQMFSKELMKTLN